MSQRSHVMSAALMLLLASGSSMAQTIVPTKVTYINSTKTKTFGPLLGCNRRVLFTTDDGGLQISENPQVSLRSVSATDQAAAGTVLCTIVPSCGIAVYKDQAYFRKWGTGGFYFTNGTTIQQVSENVQPDFGSSSRSATAEFRGGLFFQTSDGRQHLTTRGAPSTTVYINNYLGTSSSQGVVGSPQFKLVTSPTGGTALFFEATAPGFGKELFITNGLPRDAVMLKDIVPGPVSGFVPGGDDLRESAELNGKFLFILNATTNATGVPERRLWCSDGTSLGTKLIKDLVPNHAPGSTGKEWIGPLMPFGGSVVFMADANDAAVDGVWKTDGTSSGTKLVVALDPASEPVVYLKKLIIAEKSKTADKLNLMEVDLTAGTKKRVFPFNIFPDLPAGTVENFTVCNGKLYFIHKSASTPVANTLWVLDLNGTGTLKQITPAIAPNASPLTAQLGKPMLSYNNVLYFLADYNYTGTEIWKVQ